MSLGQEQDWEGRYAPLCWASNEHLQAELGIGRTQLQTYIRGLIRKGWLGMRESANGKRFGFRSANGDIDPRSAGFDLSPLAARHHELVEAVSAETVERAEVRRLKVRLGIIRREIRTLCADALGQLAEPERVAFAEALERARARLGRSLGAECLHKWVCSAESELTHLRDLWTTSLQDKKKEPWGTEKRAHKEPTTDTESKTLRKTYLAVREEVVAGGPSSPLPDDAVDALADALECLPLALVEDALPALCRIAGGPERSVDWVDLEDAAERAAVQLGISGYAVREARQVMGRRRCAVAVGLVLTRSRAGEVASSAGGYLRALTEREREGRLRLLPSLYGLRDRRRKQISLEEAPDA